MNQSNIDLFINNSGLEFMHAPEGFGWAPDRHFRADLIKNGEIHKVVLKKCWSESAYLAENYMYQNVLPLLPLKAPRIFGDKHIGDDFWLVIEDIGCYQANREDPVHRAELLRILGILHGKGKALLEHKVIDDCILGHFNSNNEEYLNKKNLLKFAETDSRFNLCDWMLDFYEYMWSEISKQSSTIIHGDTDFSNLISDGESCGLVDYEKSKIGPSLIDFSKVVEYIKDDSEFEAYLEAANQIAEEQLTMDGVIYSARLGEAYDIFHWICYDIQNVLSPSYPEYRFDEDGFIQKLERLSVIKNKIMKIGA